LWCHVCGKSTMPKNFTALTEIDPGTASWLSSAGRCRRGVTSRRWDGKVSW
jgi:hypothetical protein